MKVGFIRCMQTEDFCPGSVDFKTVAKKAAAGIDEAIALAIAASIARKRG